MKEQSILKREKRALDIAKNELGMDGEIITPENYLKFIDSITV